MSAFSTQKSAFPAEQAENAMGAGTARNRVMVALDGSHLSQKAIAHGMAAARALGAELTLMRVMEPVSRKASPADPVEWQLRRQRVQSSMEALARERGDKIAHIETQITEGRPADEICSWAREHHVGLTVLSTRGAGQAGEHEVGRTAHRLIGYAPCSILLVPADAEETSTVRYERIFVPLDGSSRAESALPIALCLAEPNGAELVLAHAVPEPELTEIGPLEPEDEELRKRLLGRNERVARDYLERVRTRFADRGVTARALILSGGDARRLLSRSIADQGADLVVLASHGRSGHGDVTVGSVATHLISHACVPLLIVRTNGIVKRNAQGSHGAPCRMDTRLQTRAAA